MFELLRLPAGWFGYVALIVAALGSIGLGGMLKTWLDHKYKSRKATDDMATAIVDHMTRRLSSVERHGRICEANLGVLRHRLNNLSGCFDATLLLIEMAPEKSADLVQKIKELRQTQMLAEAAERAAVMAAAIAPEDGVGPPPPDET